VFLTLLQSKVAPPSGEGERRPRRHTKFRKFEDEVLDLDLLQQDDNLAADFIVALVTKGFFDGKH
jgi:hypothetical protein